MWCVPTISDEFVDRMEDVLQLYARKLDPLEPVVCFDERPVVLHEDAMPGVPMRPGRLARRDYEYVRCGTANIFCIVEPLTGNRLTFATANRKRPAFVCALQKIALRYRHARRIHLVLDNLNIHSQVSLVQVLGELAQRCRDRGQPRLSPVPWPAAHRISRRSHLAGQRLAPRGAEGSSHHRMEVPRQ